MFSIPGLGGSKKGGGIRGLIGGVVSGAALLLIAMVLLFWNEGRAVKRTAVLAEGKSLVQSVEADVVSPANDGKLLHVRADLATSGRLADPEFGVEADGLALRRRVEMYQWEEKKSRRSGNEKRYDYRYEKTWDDELIVSKEFDQPSDHENPPSLPFPSMQWRAESPRLGAFVLGADAVSELSDWEAVNADASALPPNLAASLRQQGGVLTTASSLDSPAIGDVRIRFDQVPLGRASVVAQQRGEHLEPYAAKQGELLLAERGSASVEGMFQTAADENSRLGWALRAGGFMAFWLGFGLMLRPISSVLGSLPIVGGIGRMVTTVVAAALAFMLSLLTIVSGWLFNRPWLMGVMLIALAAAIFWLAKRSGNTSAGRPAPPPAPYPPPPPPSFQ